MDAKATGGLIARRRKEQNWSQGDLAERLHVTDKAISKWETGRGLPSVDLLEPLAEALGLTVSELLSGRELTPEELPKAAEAQVMESMERERRTRRRSFFATAALALIGIAAIGVGTWLAAHYLGSVPETDLEGLERQAAAYLGRFQDAGEDGFDYDALEIVETERRGDYLAALCSDGQGNWCMCVFDRDDVFSRPLDGQRRKKQYDDRETELLELRKPQGGGDHLLRRRPAGGGGLVHLPEQRHHLYLPHRERPGAGRVRPAGHRRHLLRCRSEVLDRDGNPLDVAMRGDVRPET